MNVFRRIFKPNTQHQRIFTIGLAILSYAGVKKLYNNYIIKHAMNCSRNLSIKTLEKDSDSIIGDQSMGFFIGPGLFITSYHGLEKFLNKDNLYSHITISENITNITSNLIYVNPGYNPVIVEVDKSRNIYYIALNSLSNSDSKVTFDELQENIIYVEKCSIDERKTLFDESMYLKSDAKIVFTDPSCDLALIEFSNKNNPFIDLFPRPHPVTKLINWLLFTYISYLDPKYLFMIGRKGDPNLIGQIMELLKSNTKVLVFTLGSSINAQFRVGHGYLIESKEITFNNQVYKVVTSNVNASYGFSGGPLLNRKLKLMGVNSWIDEEAGISYAISGNVVKNFLLRYEASREFR